MKTALIAVAVLLAVVGVWWFILRKRPVAPAAGVGGVGDRGTGSIIPTGGQANRVGSLLPWLEPTSSPASFYVGGTAVPKPTGLLSPFQNLGAAVNVAVNAAAPAPPNGIPATKGGLSGYSRGFY